jgi:hypothetical protein
MKIMPNNTPLNYGRDHQIVVDSNYDELNPEKVTL